MFCCGLFQEREGLWCRAWESLTRPWLKSTPATVSRRTDPRLKSATATPTPANTGTRSARASQNGLVYLKSVCVVNQLIENSTGSQTRWVWDPLFVECSQQIQDKRLPNRIHSLFRCRHLCTDESHDKYWCMFFLREMLLDNHYSDNYIL